MIESILKDTYAGIIDNFPFENIGKLIGENRIDASIKQESPVMSYQDYGSIRHCTGRIEEPMTTIELTGTVSQLQALDSDLACCTTGYDEKTARIEKLEQSFNEFKDNKKLEIADIKNKICDYKQKIRELKQAIKYEVDTDFFYSTAYKHCLEIIEDTFKNLDQYPDNYDTEY